MDETKLVGVIFNTTVEAPSNPLPIASAQSALTWDSAYLRKMLEKQGLQENGPKSLSKEQRRQARALRPDFTSLLRFRGAVLMTPMLACTPAGHTQCSHLFETPARPRPSCPEMDWNESKIWATFPSFGKLLPPSLATVPPLTDTFLGPVRRAPMPLPTWDYHSLLSGASNPRIRWSVKMPTQLSPCSTDKEDEAQRGGRDAPACRVGMRTPGEPSAWTPVLRHPFPEASPSCPPGHPP